MLLHPPSKFGIEVYLSHSVGSFWRSDAPIPKRVSEVDNFTLHVFHLQAIVSPIPTPPSFPISIVF